MRAFLSERPVAIADPDERMRHALAALVWMQFGIDSIASPSLSALVPMLTRRRPAIIIAAGDADEHCPRHLFNWLPFVPVVALGCSLRNVGEERIVTVLPRPVDADLLVGIVGTVVNVRPRGGDVSFSEADPPGSPPRLIIN